MFYNIGRPQSIPLAVIVLGMFSESDINVWQLLPGYDDKAPLNTPLRYSWEHQMEQQPVHHNFNAKDPGQIPEQAL